MRRLTLLAMLLACAPARPGLKVQPIPSVRSAIAVEYYDVSGATPEEVRGRLSAAGPSGTDGRHYDARTEWQVRWHYPHQRDPSGCRTGDPDVELKIHYLMPRLDEATTSDAVRRRWRRYLDALQAHEEGHADNGRAAARAVVDELRALPPRPTCEELVEA